MFTVKVGKDGKEAFEAEIVEEGYTGAGEERRVSLVFQFYDGGGKSIDEYEAMLSKPGALDLVQVHSASGALLSRYTGYTAAPSIHRRLLESAEPDRAVLYTIRLMKDEGMKKQ